MRTAIKVLIVILAFLLVSGVYVIADSVIRANLDMTGNDIYNASYINASHFVGDGSAITGVPGVQWTLTGDYLYNNSGNLDLNETMLNSTIDTRAGADGFWTITGNYIYNNSGSLDLNETMLNSTIDARAGSDGFWTITGSYIYNNSGSLDWNESKGNATYLPLAGGTMTGNIAMGSQNITEIDAIGSSTDGTGEIWTDSDEKHFFGNSTDYGYIYFNSTTGALIIYGS